MSEKTGYAIVICLHCRQQKSHDWCFCPYCGAQTQKTTWIEGAPPQPPQAGRVDEESLRGLLKCAEHYVQSAAADSNLHPQAREGAHSLLNEITAALHKEV